MPAPDPVRSDQPASDRDAAPVASRKQDLSAIPAFLRTGPRSEKDDAADGTSPGRAGLAMPRPVTPPPARTEGAKGGRTIDPASLPMPSLSRRRVITAAGILLAGVLSLSFAQQVG